MKCVRFEELIFERVEGILDTETAVMLDAHAAGCARCADLAILMGDGAAIPAEDFTASVLALTSDREPVERALRQLELDLPALATMAPDDDFIADVMAVTIEADRMRLHRRLGAFWDSLIQRPRLALEGAYLGAVAGFLLVGLPASPLAGVPEQVIHELRSQEIAVRTTLASSTAKLSQFSTTTWERAGDIVVLPLGDDEPGTGDAVRLNSRDSEWAEFARDTAATAWNDYVVTGADWLLSPWTDRATNDSDPNESTNEEDKDERSSHSA
ncbi:MAG: hypothetical protein GKS06_02030 [Acidobacteria bacterium]|nr:hypothetical protein [Acidobacteriota bacterium]